jgi:hypothetical protein
MPDNDKLAAELELRAKLALSEDDKPADEAAVDKYHPDIEHVYISSNAPKLRTSIIVDGKKMPIIFSDCRLVLKGAIAQAFDEQSMTVKGIRTRVKKVNKALGIELVRAHQEAMSSAVKGAADTSKLSRLKGEIASGSAKTLAEIAPNNPGELENFQQELAGGDLLITEEARGLAGPHGGVRMPQNGNPNATESPAPETAAAAKTGEHGGGLKLFAQ